MLHQTTELHRIPQDNSPQYTHGLGYDGTHLFFFFLLLFIRPWTFGGIATWKWVLEIWQRSFLDPYWRRKYIQSYEHGHGVLVVIPKRWLIQSLATNAVAMKKHEHERGSQDTFHRIYCNSYIGIWFSVITNLHNPLFIGKPIVSSLNILNEKGDTEHPH